MDLGLQDRIVIVTGGSKGIGEAIVRTFMAEGAKVVNVNRSTAEGEAMQAEFAAEGQQCLFMQGDLCEPETAQRVVDYTLEKFGQIDVIVNNAGVNDGVGLESGLDAFNASLQRNLLHVYAMVHHGLDALKKSRGAVVNIGSKVAVTGQGNTSGYAASKGAINGLTREWAVDLAPFGIRVNSVIPAEVWTPLYANWLGSLPNPEATRKAIEQLVPLEHRFTTAQELADMVVFLASQRSLHTTGQIVYVDGGYTHLDRKCTAS